MSAAPPHRPAAQPGGEPPASIRTSVALVWAVVAASVLNAVLSLWFLDALAAAAVETEPALTAETARAGVVSSAVSAVVFGALWVLLAIFLRRGANWARIVLSIFAGIGVITGVPALTLSSKPLLLTVVGAVTLVLEIALLYFLWQRESGGFLKPPPTS
jgi:hypothetical protein